MKNTSKNTSEALGSSWLKEQGLNPEEWAQYESQKASLKAKGQYKGEVNEKDFFNQLQVQRLNQKREAETTSAVEQAKQYAGGQADIASKGIEEAYANKGQTYENLLSSYLPAAHALYDTSKTNIENLLKTSQSNIENLYNTGYSDLKNIIGQESEAAIKDNLRPIENKLNAQGLLGGPSGALNEALAGASERVRNANIGRLADFTGAKTGALANLYGSNASTLSNLENTYAGQQQGLLEQALGLKTGLASDVASAGAAGAQNKLSALLGLNVTGLDMAAQNAANEANSKLALLLAQMQKDQQQQPGFFDYLVGGSSIAKNLASIF